MLHSGDAAIDWLMTEKRSLIIEAGRVERHYWADLWRYRELFFFLAWRDILVRYKQTALGAAWALLRPFLTMVVFSLVFGKLANMPSGGVPYPILVFAALLPWQLFANGFSEAGNSLISNANMISKVYFPRLVVPAATVIVSVVDYGISLLMLAAIMLWYGFMPSWQILALPLLTLMVVALAIGAGLLTAALNVRFRDFRFVVPFAIQLGLYISPVGFSSSIVPEKWRPIYSLNPMVGVIESFRWAILGNEYDFPWSSLISSLLVTLALLGVGITYFRRTEKAFADLI